MTTGFSSALTGIPTDQAEVTGDLQTVLKALQGRRKLLIKTAMVQTHLLNLNLTSTRCG